MYSTPRREVVGSNTVNQTVKTIATAAAITISLAALQYNTGTLPRAPLPPPSYSVPPRPAALDVEPPKAPSVAPSYSEPPQWALLGVEPPATPYGYPQQAAAFGYSSLLKSFADPSALGSADNQLASAPAAEPPAKDALSGQQQKSVVLAPLRQPKFPVVRIQFEANALPPLAYMAFCLKYPNDCKAPKIVFRGGPVKLNRERWADLVRVNAQVNRSIIPEPNTKGLAAEKWLISPQSGECHDYAVTKRHELLARGWPARNLLLAEVMTSWGEHHLVLVVRTSDGDFVADNLNANIRSWNKTQYQWLRIESATNPKIWATVASTTVWVSGTRLADLKS